MLRRRSSCPFLLKTPESFPAATPPRLGLGLGLLGIRTVASMRLRGFAKQPIAILVE
jgi:hypothetical protein